MVAIFPPLLTRDGRPAAELWALDPDFHHLNHGSFGAVPQAVIQHQQGLHAEMRRNPVKWICELPDRVAEARTRVARQLGSDAQRTAFVSNLSAGISCAFNALDNRGPIDVLVTSHGYGAVVMGAERLARRTGGALHTIEIPMAATADEVCALVHDAVKRHRPRLFVVDQVTSATARAFPTTELCRVAHELGALVYVDGAHAPGVLEDPVEHEADVWVGNLHKFWCAPMGAAALVCNNPELDLYPVIASWDAPYPFPRRFDAQGTIDNTAWLCAPLAYEHLETELGWRRIREHSRMAIACARERVAEALSALGVEDPLPDVGQSVGPLLLARLPGTRAWDHESTDALRVPFMNRTGIVSAFTNIDDQAYVRLSAHAYTTEADISAMTDHGIPILAEWIEAELQERNDQ
ncbi:MULTISPECIES: aminotransferase class V-fold PLP-dependent enzyme [unclassified Luteococcus]|uniref:aminotransferase class V-fold PLP-dependent enzyme n=1 Tax=unclassified Luteococcus TaxID=2639923 RepID=UPI00313E1BA3